MMKRQLIVSIVVVALAYAGLSAYVIANQGIEELLVCADKGELKIPLSKALCRSYLFALRGSRQDIDSLHQTAGASFVVQGESAAAEREQILKFLIDKGLDVNRTDMHQLTPLHAAVIANSADEVRMLLANGANGNAKDKKFGLTPLELALKLQTESKSPNERQAVVSALKNPQ